MAKVCGHNFRFQSRSPITHIPPQYASLISHPPTLTHPYSLVPHPPLLTRPPPTHTPLPMSLTVPSLVIPLWLAKHNTDKFSWDVMIGGSIIKTTSNCRKRKTCLLIQFGRWVSIKHRMKRYLGDESTTTTTTTRLGRRWFDILWCCDDEKKKKKKIK